MATVVRDNLDGFLGSAALIEAQGEFYIVSSVDSAFDTGRPETLVFPATADGEVASWMDVAGGQGMSRDEAIADLEAKLAEDQVAA